MTMLSDKIRMMKDTYTRHIMKCRVDADIGRLAVLSDIHEGLNDRQYLQDSVQFLLKLGNTCKVVIGGDCTNTTTKNSKGNVLEEWGSGDEQILALVDDIRPLYESGQLLGIIQGNHTQRAFNDAYITIEMMIATLLGDRNLYKGSMGIVYFNVNKNLYVHQIIHKHSVTMGAYDFFNADVSWYEHKHKPMARNKLIIEHNKYEKHPMPKECWDLFQSSFQTYPDYAKSASYRPSIPSYFICEMSGIKNDHSVVPYLDHDLARMIDRGYTI